MQASYLSKGHLTCGWNKGEEQFPEQSNEVHDVVPTRRQLLFVIASSSVVSYKKRKLDIRNHKKSASHSTVTTEVGPISETPNQQTG